MEFFTTSRATSIKSINETDMEIGDPSGVDEAHCNMTDKSLAGGDAGSEFKVSLTSNRFLPPNFPNIRKADKLIV